MKNLSDYTDEAISEIMNRHGAFFAFSDRQFVEAKKPGVVYVSCGQGLICPKAAAVDLTKEIIAAGEAGVAADLAENGIDAIIRRELINYESYYTGDISDTVSALARYGISEEQILAVYHEERKHQ